MEVSMISQLQDQNEKIAKIKRWRSYQSFPGKLPRNQSDIIKKLWFMRKKLIMVGQILYREYEGQAHYKSLRVVLPRSHSNQIMTKFHKNPMERGHLSVDKMLSKLVKRFYWINMKQDVINYCQTCMECSEKDNPAKTLTASLITTRCSYPFERIALDVLGPLPRSRSGNRDILVTEACLFKSIDAPKIADILVGEFFSKFGVPDELYSDQGGCFESDILRQICQLHKIKKTRTTPYHPQSDGMIERFNRTLIGMLSKASMDPMDWDKNLQ
ncbi:Retrovirus-related Pol polyprotein [Thelohanellus kitauei]|uniref:Retrovirus-related Pol polyprotein n=1 Tax=Thelohanellus kitauei TaxID=669202 RepID=A0A0C2ND00_THEKT|nr:Retrovirus-related Pol polyprotein [Thelohanellus kitauei]